LADAGFPPGLNCAKANPIFAGEHVMAKNEAIEAMVTGRDQKVGFRALVMKQAIEYNLAGSAINEPDQVVRFTLQGAKERIDEALTTIQQGTKKSSDIQITTSLIERDPELEAFTIVDWTSSSRNITKKYTLVYKLRPKDKVISREEAQKKWHKVLEKTLDAEDRAKLHLDD
jgi:acylphosphatase